MKFVSSLISRWIFGRINEFRKHLDQVIANTKSSDCEIRLRDSWTSLIASYRYRLSPTMVDVVPAPVQSIQVAPPVRPQVVLAEDSRLVIRAPAVGQFYNPDQKILGQHKKGTPISLMLILEQVVEIKLEVIWLSLGEYRYMPIMDFSAIRVVKILPNHGDPIEFGQELCLVEIVQPEADNET